MAGTEIGLTVDVEEFSYALQLLICDNRLLNFLYLCGQSALALMNENCVQRPKIDNGYSAWHSVFYRATDKVGQALMKRELRKTFQKAVSLKSTGNVLVRLHEKHILKQRIRLPLQACNYP